MTDDMMELEANAFAMELLMPEEWIKRDIKGIDLLDTRAVEALAKRYQVSVPLMSFRIGQLMERASQ
jgi:Zn-dependent peptidase ImmA (M78 family)